MPAECRVLLRSKNSKKLSAWLDFSIRTEPVSKEYEEKWGGELTVGQYILSAKVFARKPQ